VRDRAITPNHFNRSGRLSNKQIHIRGNGKRAPAEAESAGHWSERTTQCKWQGKKQARNPMPCMSSQAITLT
jgi:hypothetical protein